MSPFRSALLFIMVSLGLSVAAVAISKTHLEWRVGHIGLYQSLPVTDWARFQVNNAVNDLVTKFKSANTPGLNTVQLFISQKAQNNLMSNIPSSTKHWQEAHMIYPDSTLRRVKVRYRGDNPFNWVYGKKSLKVKTRKKRTIGNVRVFNYITPQDPSLIAWHFYRNWPPISA